MRIAYYAFLGAVNAFTVTVMVKAIMSLRKTRAARKRYEQADRWAHKLDFTTGLCAYCKDYNEYGADCFHRNPATWTTTHDPVDTTWYSGCPVGVPGPILGPMLSTQPPNPIVGSCYFNTYSGKIRIYNGNGWIDT